VTPSLPLKPSRDNAGRGCTLGDAGEMELPAHIQPCLCDTHDGVCTECNYKITVGANGREYGHARATNGSPPNRRDCPHRPAACDPAKRNGTRGGESA